MRRKKSNFIPEKELKCAFKTWLTKKHEELNESKFLDLEENIRDIACGSADDFNIELVDRCIKIIINEGFPPSAMEYVFKRMNYLYANDWIIKQAPYFCKVEFDCINYPNALDWTLVNVCELKFFDMSDIDFKIPYNQCHFCGKPDGFEHKEGYKKFNKKRKYCHRFDCEHIHDANGSNPMLHQQCHFGKFAIQKKKLYEQMRVAKKSIEEKVQLFIDFCNKRFEENLKIEWSVQTKEQRGIYQDDWDDKNSWNNKNYKCTYERNRNID